eukprot:CAMPEP_0172453608 /NCGR_PEP_ID=MMETSP1065-20121228/10846_1 /TAXON_ID=265537 /ORGANISM="Amphiprora paludosa, Strain CCMP125" /LENGTH=545 /DNA_ID=CAMNT_0013205793 /DNA_START=56 /DNA_END=1693 /DNA_ORIENTATION=-
MLGLAREGAMVSARLATTTLDNGGAGEAKTLSAGKKRRIRRKKNSQKKKDSLIPEIKTAKFRGGERHVAQDLYRALRCSWCPQHPQQQQLTRVILANWQGQCVYESAVDSNNFLQVREKILNLTLGKVVIGHSLDYSFHLLQIQHPWANLRDGASYLPFMQEKVDPLTVMVVPRSLHDLAGDILDRRLPNDVGSSEFLREEAKACMDLYRAVRLDWENEITKLMRQKERQKAVTRVPEPLPSIVEDGLGGPSFSSEESLQPGKAPPLTKSKVGWQKAVSDDGLGSEDQSTQAPTEITHDEELTHDDVSVNTKTSSNASIWMPQENASEDGSRGSSSWGLWLPRPEKESTHPIDADDWLNEEPALTLAGDEDGGDCSVESSTLDLLIPRKEKGSSHPIDADDWLNEEVDDTARGQLPQESGEAEAYGQPYLPSRLLDGSSSEDSDHEPTTREASNHYVEGTDWLEPTASPRKNRDRRSSWHRRQQQGEPAASLKNDEDYVDNQDASPMFSFFRKRAPAPGDASNPSSSERSSRISGSERSSRFLQK